MTVPSEPKESPKPEFDADFSPNNPVNKKAAVSKRVKYNPATESYEDEDCCMIYDRFGQRY